MRKNLKLRTDSEFKVLKVESEHNFKLQTLDRNTTLNFKLQTSLYH